jgi:hypothetical protein
VIRVLGSNEFFYSQERRPLNELDLSKALEIKDDFDEAEKENCFRLLLFNYYLTPIMVISAYLN